eukprot:1891231-Prymnesium_polylepis.1
MDGMRVRGRLVFLFTDLRLGPPAGIGGCAEGVWRLCVMLAVFGDGVRRVSQSVWMWYGVCGTLWPFT